MQNVAILGVGLIGGSLGLALKVTKRYKVKGYGRPTTLEKAIQKGAIDEGSDQLEQAVDDCQIIVLATPVGAFKAILQSLKPIWQDDWVVMDVGSTKNSVEQDLISVFGQIPSNFIFAHPIAGKEQIGVDSAVATLFNDATVVLCPHTNNSASAYETTVQMWQDCGALIQHIDINDHDKILAQVSHMPHMLAFAMVDFIIHSEYKVACFDLAAGGFGDFSRTASSSPAMWRDIALANKEPINKALSEYIDRLKLLQANIDNEDADALFEFMNEAKTARDAWMKQKNR